MYTDPHTQLVLAHQLMHDRQEWAREQRLMRRTHRRRRKPVRSQN